VTTPDDLDPQDDPTQQSLGEESLPDAPLRAILEGMLFASDEPVTIDEVSQILGEDRREDIVAALESLSKDYSGAGRGLRVQQIAGGYRITTQPDMGPFIRELVRSRNRQRLSRAALETLAIVAYKQPITAPEVQEIRGVNPSAILTSLLNRRLVRILGRKKVVGKPFLYGTTREFLVRFGLNSLDDLPDVEEFDALLAAESGEDPEPAPPPPSPAEGASGNGDLEESRE